MQLIQQGNNTEALDFGELNLPVTLDCGQAFRWEKCGEDTFIGAAFGKETRVRKTENGLLFIDTPIEDVEELWADYFDLHTDHNEILTRLTGDPHIKAAYERFGTLRILNQPEWETLCSFIISSCNNIPRIKGIIKRLCEAYGKKTGECCSFPDADVLAVKTVEELAFLRAGYRAEYIIDAARRVAEGEIDLKKLKLSDEDSARRELMKIKGVGKKVADCTMLFSLGFKNVYPVDRHILRATEELYPDGIPDFFEPHSGLAQQYIFLSRITK